MYKYVVTVRFTATGKEKSYQVYALNEYIKEVEKSGNKILSIKPINDDKDRETNTLF